MKTRLIMLFVLACSDTNPADVDPITGDGIATTKQIVDHVTRVTGGAGDAMPWVDYLLIASDRSICEVEFKVFVSLANGIQHNCYWARLKP